MLTNIINLPIKEFKERSSEPPQTINVFQLEGLIVKIIPKKAENQSALVMLRFAPQRERDGVFSSELVVRIPTHLAEDELLQVGFKVLLEGKIQAVQGTTFPRVELVAYKVSQAARS